MKLRFGVLGATIAIASCASAFTAMADGYYGPHGAYAPLPFVDWTGFYIGGFVGVDWQDVGATSI